MKSRSLTLKQVYVEEGGAVDTSEFHIETMAISPIQLKGYSTQKEIN